MYKRKYNIGLAISGAVAVLMLASPTWFSLILNTILGMILVVLCCHFSKIDEYIKVQRNLKSTVIGIVFSLIVGIQFYEKWKYSSMLSMLAIKIGIGKNMLLFLISSIGVIIISWFCIGVIILLRDCYENKINNSICKILYSKKIWYFGCMIAAIGIALQLYYCISMDIWLDEAFSLKIIEHSYYDMIVLTAQDVHPPLYYIILKGSVDFFSNIMSNLSKISIAKVVSMIPEFCLILYTILAIHKKDGRTNYIAGMFMICLIGMPQMSLYSIEIRMYSWGLLFVTMAFFAMSQIIKENKIGHWIKFLIYSLMAAYTHYFACISVALFYVALFVWFFKINKKMLKRWFTISLITILGYLPWLYVLIGQVLAVKKEYWIQEITIESIKYYVSFIFDEYWFFGIYILLLLFACKKQKKWSNQEQYIIICALSCVLWTVLVGVIASVLFRPVFVSRYVVPALGCLQIGIVLAIDKLKQVRIQLVLSLLILLMCCTNMIQFVQSEHYLKAENEKVQGLIAEIDRNDTIVISTTSECNRILAALIENECYLWQNKESVLSRAVYSNLGSEVDIEDLKDGSNLTKE